MVLDQEVQVLTAIALATQEYYLYSVDGIVIFHFELTRCLRVTQSPTISKEANLVQLQALPLTILLHELLEHGLPLDFEVNRAIILQGATKNRQQCGNFSRCESA